MGPHTLIQCAYIPYESILQEQGSNDLKWSRCGAALLLGFGENVKRAGCWRRSAAKRRWSPSTTVHAVTARFMGRNSQNSA
jgi:hypothetical protein